MAEVYNSGLSQLNFIAFNLLPIVKKTFILCNLRSSLFSPRNPLPSVPVNLSQTLGNFW